MLLSILSIVIALGVLITFHEFGHYYVARRCGVKVLRFSVGFGKPFYRFVNSAGTEFTLAMIPLGGYVRMLDERESGAVSPELKSQAFNNKTVGQRMAIVAAGPLANFLLAIVLYFMVAMLGVKTLAPIVGEIHPNSPISQTQVQSGDILTQIGDEKVQSWEDVNLALARLIGHQGDVIVRYRPAQRQTLVEDSIRLDRWLVNEQATNLIASFGLAPLLPKTPAIVADVVPDSAAARAGLQIGDTILFANQQTIEQWKDFVNIIQSQPNNTVILRVLRNEQTLELDVIPEGRDVNGQIQGYVGLAVQPVVMDDSWFHRVDYNPITALVYGVEQTWKMVSLTFSSVGKMLQGLISLDNLSGPITIAKVASASAESGLQTFLKFMAYLSVSLGVLNLLPIPMLDGGHLLFFSIEAIRRKPVSERIQFFAYRIGASLLFALMAFAIFNDIARL